MSPKQVKVRPLQTAGQSLPAESTGRRRFLTVFPAVLVALLPKAACPACWPAYFGLLGAVGISIVVDFGPYLLPLTALALLVVLGTLGYRARRRRGYGPLTLGILASALILYSKSPLAPDAPLYVGIVLLIGASIWNSWPTGAARRSACAPQTPTGKEM